MNAQDFLPRLERARKQGDGWQACCPAHEDKRASLSVQQADDGKLLLKCHAGCETTAVVRALGLKMQDLFPARPKKQRRAKAKIVTTYDYRDEAGELLFQVCRLEPKSFRQRRRNGKGWSWSVKGVRAVTYRLDDLEHTDPTRLVFIAEGEKDVDALWKHGLAATCNAGGADNWRDVHAQCLKGRPVAILPDNDGPGRKFAQQVARTLQGVATSIKVVELPDLPDGGDVSDWLAAGGDADTLLSFVYQAHEYESEPTPPALTELGNSERFVAKFGDTLRYCHPWRKWLRWDGVRWHKDRDLAVMEMAKTIPRELFADFQRTNSKDLGKWALKSQGRSCIEAQVALTRSALPVLPDRLDRGRWLFNVPNGTIDLRTGTLRAPSRSDYLTTVAPVPFDPAATCPTWDRFLDRIMDGNRDLLDYLRRAVGYSLTGDVGEQCLFILHGGGANGKSTFLDAVHAAIGHEYSKAMAPNILMAKKYENHPTELADLFGARFVSTVEVQQDREFDEVRLKQITGGDPIKARRMREDFWEFEPTHKIWLAANHKPVINGTDHAIWRRIRLVPFTVTIPTDERDKDLPEKLRAELPGIMAWAVRGCLEWQRHGLQDPDEVLVATRGYRKEMDPLDPFLVDRCVVDPQAHGGAGELYLAYKQWAKENRGDNPMSKVDFGKLLGRKGFEKGKGNRGKRLWRGVGLTAPLHLDHEEV